MTDPDPTLTQIAEERREEKMKTARLEHAILQTIINHVAENHLTREQIVMAVINVASYWQRKVILSALQKNRMESDE